MEGGAGTGGAIYQSHGTLTVLQCSFAGNVVVGSGSSIAATRAQVILRNSIHGAGVRPDFDLETLQAGFVAALRAAFDQNPQSDEYRSLTAVGGSLSWILN